jgi:hypothetical protein
VCKKLLAEGLGTSALIAAKFGKEHPGKRRYLPAKDSAAFAAKALYLLGLDSITFISCQS